MTKLIEPWDRKGPSRPPKLPKPVPFPPQDWRGPDTAEEEKKPKCKKGLTELVIIRDESGSMAHLVNDMEQGLNKFLSEQREQKGQCNVTFYRFSNNVERVFDNHNLKYTQPPKMNASGGTALFDAVGRAIDEVSARLYNTPEKERPELVIVQIITDGEENSSRYVNLQTLQQKVSQQQEVYKWQFVFVGSNFDAWAKGQDYGFKGGKSIQYESSHDGVACAYMATSQLTSSMRKLAGDDVALDSFSFTDTQRKAAMTK